MELDQLLTTIDKVSVNLEKLERVWERASPHLPSGPHLGSTPEYQTLARTWHDLLPGLPPIDGWTITEDLPDMDDLGRAFLDYAEIGELPQGAWAAASKPGEDLAEYRYRLDRSRRRAISSRLSALTDRVTSLVRLIVADLPTRQTLLAQPHPQPQQARVDTPDTFEVVAAITEIERLLGGTVERKGRWGNLHRHLHFSEILDWHDILEMDWPSVREDIDAAKAGDADPITVPSMDLGIAAMSPTGNATTSLKWSELDPDDFERLLYDILRGLDGYQNVEWLMNTNAPDRGRDLSLERVVQDSAGSTRTERVIVQAKHYTSKAVGPADVQHSLASLTLWEPPVIRILVIATSGRFSSDAVGIAEKHNDLGNRPHIELWSNSRLETLLAQRPGLAITYGLRS